MVKIKNWIFNIFGPIYHNILDHTIAYILLLVIALAVCVAIQIYFEKKVKVKNKLLLSCEYLGRFCVFYVFYLLGLLVFHIFDITKITKTSMIFAQASALMLCTSVMYNTLECICIVFLHIMLCVKKHIAMKKGKVASKINSNKYSQYYADAMEFTNRCMANRPINETRYSYLLHRKDNYIEALANVLKPKTHNAKDVADYYYTYFLNFWKNN